jgi:hypothetical protein
LLLSSSSLSLSLISVINLKKGGEWFPASKRQALPGPAWCRIKDKPEKKDIFGLRIRLSEGRFLFSRYFWAKA